MIHTPTLLLINILVTATLALCLGAVSTRGQRDGLLWWAWGLAAHTLAYVLIGLRGQIPDGLSVVLGNTLMTTSLALIAEGVYQFQQRKPQRGWVWTPVVVMLVAFSFLQANIQARVLLNAVLLSFQCVLLLGLILGRRHVTPGRGQYFVVAGLMLLLTLLLLRGVGALTGWMQLTSITDSNVVQAATFIFATLGIMLIALGLVLMTKEDADERNRRLALQDELTGLHNRRFILEVLAQQLALARRNNRPLAVMILDLDYFKRVNDTHGHLVGDQVLRDVAACIQIRLRAQDIAGRWGGEEFIVILPDTDASGAAVVAEQLRQAVEQTHFEPAEGQPLQLTLSIGLQALEPGAAHGRDELLGAADQALYLAKRYGRNRVERA